MYQKKDLSLKRNETNFLFVMSTLSEVDEVVVSFFGEVRTSSLRGDLVCSSCLTFCVPVKFRGDAKRSKTLSYSHEIDQNSQFKFCEGLYKINLKKNE
jgi:hypothetical protein